MDQYESTSDHLNEDIQSDETDLAAGESIGSSSDLDDIDSTQALETNEDSIDSNDDEQYLSSGSKEKYRVLCCHRCCRPEKHAFLPSKNNTFFLTVLFTLGLVYIVGPFMCVCCGNRRLFNFNWKDPNKVPTVSKRFRRNSGSIDHSWKREQKLSRFKKRTFRLFRKLTKPIRDLFTKRNMHF